METRARFVLIGLCTILGFAAMLGFVLWLAKVQLDRTYAQYDILLGTAAGLSQTAAVRYNGVDVGNVLTIALDRDDPALVRVRIEIFASTPVRTDTVATLASQGVTGVAFIALEGGSATAEPLRPLSQAAVPVILSERSVVQDLMVTGPDLLAEATALIADVRGFATPENRDAVAGILANVEGATGRIDALVTRADVTLSRVDYVLDALETSLVAADGLLAQDVPDLMVSLRAAIDSTAGAMDAVGGVARADMPRLSAQVGTLIQEASGVIATFDALARQIGSDPGRFLLGNETPEYRR
ncbi:MlaD family protein [Roseisalinus antarcticus]|uniref:Mce related protein n=1 Tax=Roseisalinus antarcticus TaxID=254357 RepID=A0A1Y5TZ14_9RHOB|nr:MlaD family protein [Roseisalinus antarcticus]SLN77108.1 mce related protein [Roseisalinus antarcticus]